MPGKYNRKDHLYEKAKEEGHRSRAAYKLKELNQRFKLIKSRSKVLELGAWPGGWLAVAAELTGEDGLVVGVDLVQIEPLALEQVVFIKGDVRDQQIIDEVSSLAPNGYDVIISDMSAKISGVREIDQAQIVGLAKAALEIAKSQLRAGGMLVIKVFKGNSTETFFKEFRKFFEKTQRCELDSSRATSNEFYLVGISFKNNNLT